MVEIALATCAKFPGLYAEEGNLPARFAAQDVRAEIAIWNAPGVDWSRFDAVVLRSVWDYFERFDEFRRWCARLEELGVPLVNPLPLVRWNMDKIYLRELEGRGARLLPTAFLPRGERADLAAEVDRRGWNEVILKPSVSAGGWRTYRIPAGGAARFQPQLDEILTSSAALLQPFAREVLADGELSLFFFGGVYSHAVVKRPAAGDFRSQPLLGATVAAVDPPAGVLEEAQRLLGLLPAEATYARVDGLLLGGRFHLMELEAIEPYLFTTGKPEALDRYAAAVAAAVTARRTALG